MVAGAAERGDERRDVPVLSCYVGSRRLRVIHFVRETIYGHIAGRELTDAESLGLPGGGGKRQVLTVVAGVALREAFRRYVGGEQHRTWVSPFGFGVARKVDCRETPRTRPMGSGCINAAAALSDEVVGDTNERPAANWGPLSVSRSGLA